MTADELSPREEEALNAMPKRTTKIASEMGIAETTVWDLVANLRRKGFNVVQDGNGKYYVPDLHTPGTERAKGGGGVRTSSSSKAKITREANDFLEKIETSLSESLEDIPPTEVEATRTGGGEDMIIPRGDDHFGQVIENAAGEQVFNSEIAERRVRYIFDQIHEIKQRREEMGIEFDTAHLILGGDIVTNESIYEGQAHEIDENLGEQIERAASVYMEEILRLSDAFPTVQVVATPGNHGEIRASNPSSGANADRIFYNSLDRHIRLSDEIDNVEFIQSAVPYYVNFEARDWRIHVRHGHGASLEHIGTSAGKQRWSTWLADHNFDAAFRFHYHMVKEEPIHGAPVFMGGTIVPQSVFEESIAISGEAKVAVHGVTDSQPDAWTERISFG